MKYLALLLMTCCSIGQTWAQSIVLNSVPERKYLGHAHFHVTTLQQKTELICHSIDSVIVEVHSNTDNSEFQVVPATLSPTGGVKAFSRRFHDFLRYQIDQGVVDAKTLVKISEFSFIVERDGSLTSLDTGIARQLFTTFVGQEKRWSQGISSGNPLRNKVTLKIVDRFIRTGSGWPDEFEWVKFKEFQQF